MRKLLSCVEKLICLLNQFLDLETAETQQLGDGGVNGEDGRSESLSLIQKTEGGFYAGHFD